MMLKSIRIAGLAVAAALAGPAALAQGNPGVGENDWEGPVNLPPAGFTGIQFVDNSGCVFVRAGVDGDTQWVPRVTRSREQVCGMPPTFRTVANGGTGTPAPVPAQPQTAQAQAQPVQTQATTPLAQAQPQTAQVQPLPQQPAPQVTADPVQAQAAALRAQAEARARADVASNGLPTAGKERALRPGTAAPHIVRRFPSAKPKHASASLHKAPVVHYAPAPQHKKVHKVEYRPVTSVTPGTAGVTPHSWIVPKHVYIERQGEAGVQVPYGYEPLFDDGRFNPYRGWQKAGDYVKGQTLWTNTVPRELVVTNPHAVDAHHNPIPKIVPPNVIKKSRGHVPQGHHGYGYAPAYGH